MKFDMACTHRRKVYGQADADSRHLLEEESAPMHRWVHARKRRPVDHSTDSARSYAVPLAEVFKMASKECSSISISPEVMAGAPCISGTRIPVYGILDAVDHHGTLQGALESYPRLKIEEVKDAVLFAKLVVECPIED